MNGKPRLIERLRKDGIKAPDSSLEPLMNTSPRTPGVPGWPEKMLSIGGTELGWPATLTGSETTEQKSSITTRCPESEAGESNERED